jgi:hypothetical protein
MKMTPQRTQWLLIGIFLAIVFIPPVSQYAIELRRAETPYVTELFFETPTAQNLRTFEKAIEDRSLITTYVRPAAQYALFFGLRDGGEMALRGNDNWLYYTPDIKYLTQPWPKESAKDAQSSDAFQAIVAFRDELKALGIELLVLPVPVRPRVYPEPLDAECSRSHAEDLIEALDAAGVANVNLFPIFDKVKQESPTEIYLTQDSHWGPSAIKIAAELVAQRILELGWIERGNSNYKLTPKISTRMGDVWDMIKVPATGMDIVPETIPCEQLTDVATGKLFEPDQSSEIIVIGDSFIGIFETDQPLSAGFPSQLSYALNRPVALLCRSGGASTVVRELLAQRPQLLEGKKVLVWEFIERELRFGLDGWKVVKLPRPAAE